MNPDASRNLTPGLRIVFIAMALAFLIALPYCLGSSGEQGMAAGVWGTGYGILVGIGFGLGANKLAAVVASPGIYLLLFGMQIGIPAMAFAGGAMGFFLGFGIGSSLAMACRPNLPSAPSEDVPEG